MFSVTDRLKKVAVAGLCLAVAIAAAADARSAALGTSTERRIESAAQQVNASGETGDPRNLGITGYVTVRNCTPFFVKIFINGVDRGSVAPYSEGSGWVGDDASDVTTLYATAPGTTVTWGPHYVAGAFSHYTWTLNQ